MLCRTEEEAPVACGLAGLREAGWAGSGGKRPRWAALGGLSLFFLICKSKFTVVEKEKYREVGEEFGRNKNIHMLLELYSI